MFSCVFPGSFDPVTAGHIDLISRAACIFEQVTVTVMVNIGKSGTISLEKRVKLLQTACKPYDNVRIESWTGLLSDYMREKNEKIIIRGLRNGAEFDHEYISDTANKMLNSDVETLFLPCKPALQAVSSSAVREIAAFGGDISRFVPAGMAEEIAELLSKKQNI